MGCCHQTQQQHTAQMELCTTSSQFHIHQLVVLAQMALSQSTACNPTSTISLFSSVFTRSGLSWISSTTSSLLTPQCTYNYPFTTVHEAFDFTQKLTRFGESGVWGFQAHLDSREVAQLLDQSIATEARQQMIFRQFSGLFPMPVWFETGIPQSWAWTLLAPYISSCPANSKRLVWQNFPALTALNQPNSARRNATQTGFNETTGFGPAAPSSDPPADESCVGNNVTGFDCTAAISQNRSIPLSYPGRQVFLEWDNPGQAVGPNNSYITATSAGAPEWVLWVSQLNITYSPLTNSRCCRSILVPGRLRLLL